MASDHGNMVYGSKRTELMQLSSTSSFAQLHSACIYKRVVVIHTVNRLLKSFNRTAMSASYLVDVLVQMR